MQDMIVSPDMIIRFWFEESGPDTWFATDPVFDQRITERFAATHRAGSLGELYQWRQTASGRLAEIIVLDQLSRNIHRGSAGAFACDGMALALAQEAVACGADRDVSDRQRHFMYMPYMHSESPVIHDVARGLFASLDDGGRSAGFEEDHRAVIERFGRYPLRNRALGRTNTPQEAAYVAEQEGKSRKDG